ncbi:MAG: electron transport complex subunit RsxB [Rhizobacter sp.]|nr:electron transport complex subunit RsxB [Rhizobacter sp.]
MALPDTRSQRVDAIDAVLPQTQCTRCGYPDCRSYAEAIADAQAPINQCPPGGAQGVLRLAELCGQSALPLNPANGHEGPRLLAVIDEAWCIGCTLCIKVCPTEAILGSNKMMHTVIEPWCTGCELCVPVCPVDCILLEKVSGDLTGWQAWSPAQADTALARYAIHTSLRHDESPDAADDIAPADEPANEPGDTAPPADPAADRKRAMIDAAMAKAKARRNNC